MTLNAFNERKANGTLELCGRDSEYTERIKYELSVIDTMGYSDYFLIVWDYVNFAHKNNITGLTTAAGIWATSGVGMAIGAGMYSIGIASTVMIIVAQIVLHLRGGGTKLLKTKTIIIKDVEDIEYNSHITEVFNNLGVKIVDVTIDKVGSARNYA